MISRCVFFRPSPKKQFLFLLVLSVFPFGVYAADGSGTNVVTPTSASVSATDQTFTFTYTAAEALSSGGIAITIPTSSSWSTPQGVAGTAGRTTVAMSGSAMVADSINEADSATSWTMDDTDTCNRFSRFPDGWGVDTGVYYEAPGAISCDNRGSSAPDATDSLSFDYGSAQNFSAYTRLAFWFRSDVDMNSTSLRVGLDDSAACDSIDDSFAVSAVTANTWTYINGLFTGAGSTRSAVQAICFYFAGNIGMDGKQWWVDDILMGPGSPVFVANGSDTDIRARFLQMALNETATVTYGAGGGTSGVDLPSTPGVNTITTKSHVDSGGTLTSISSSPTITLTTPLAVSIVDSGGSAVGSPSVGFSSTTFPYSTTTTTGTLGTSSEKIRISNGTGSGAWSVTMAPTSGSTALWTSGGNTYDFNDSNTDGTDDADTDSKGGRLTVNPTGITVTPVSPCASTTGVSAGSSSSFREVAAAVSSITLVSASSGASGFCTWDVTGVGLSQVIPGRQPTGTYTLSFTITIS